MIKSIAVLAAGLCATAALAADSPNVTTVTAEGQGGWEMICHVLAAGGESTRILNAGHGSFSARNLSSLSCDYKNRSPAPLVVSISGPNIKCPLKVTGSAPCKESFAKASVGSFSMKLKR